MALKQLIFGLLAFVCNRGSEKSFMTKIKGTGSEEFFEAFFKEISNDKPHTFAVFEMNAGLVNGTLEIPVAAWQVREFYFAFGHEDVKKVFGFENAEKKKHLCPKVRGVTRRRSRSRPRPKKIDHIRRYCVGNRKLF